MRDVFRPRCEPARCIYDALVAEQEKREGRAMEEWKSTELAIVFRKTNEVARSLGLTLVTHKDVERADTYASGHIDYGAKFAYRIVELLQEKQIRNDAQSRTIKELHGDLRTAEKLIEVYQRVDLK